MWPKKKTLKERARLQKVRHPWPTLESHTEDYLGINTANNGIKVEGPEGGQEGGDDPEGSQGSGKGPEGDNDPEGSQGSGKSPEGGNDPEDSNGPKGGTSPTPPDGLGFSGIIFDAENKSATECWTKNNYTTVTHGLITILVEEKTKRRSSSPLSIDGTQSNYIVEIWNPNTKTYHREIKSANYVADLLPQWRTAKNPMILYTYTADDNTENRKPAEKNTFTKQAGPVTKFHWFACRGLNQADLDTMARNPGTKCCIEFANLDGPRIALMTELPKFMKKSDLGEFIELSADRDNMRTPKNWQPKRYIEKNLNYHDQKEIIDPLKQEPMTWRQIKNKSYAEQGITLDNRAMVTDPGSQLGAIATDKSGPPELYINRVISKELEKERKITNDRFERIESNVHGLQNKLGEHTQYFKEIIGMLKGNSPAAPPVTQTSGHTTVPIGGKLTNALGSFGNGSSVREDTLPPYGSPMPHQGTAMKPSVEG